MARSKDKVKPRTEPIDLYCHIACRRPQNKDYGLFNATFTKDYEGKETVVSETYKKELWKDDQYVTAIQSYEFALFMIYKYQAKFRDYIVGNIYLVTDNSILRGWIEDPNKNNKYSYYMRKAIEKYRPGEPKMLDINVGLSKKDITRTAGHKFCKEEYVGNLRDYIRSKQGGEQYKNKLEVEGRKITEIEDSE